MNVYSTQAATWTYKKIVEPTFLVHPDARLFAYGSTAAVAGITLFERLHSWQPLCQRQLKNGQLLQYLACHEDAELMSTAYNTTTSLLLITANLAVISTLFWELTQFLPAFNSHQSSITYFFISIIFIIIKNTINAAYFVFPYALWLGLSLELVSYL